MPLRAVQPVAPAPRAAMRAHLLVRPGQIRLAELERPVAGPDEVVVRVRAALTCGTDLKAFLRGHPKFPMPTPFGHEFSGEVAEIGGKVNGFREGDPVMAVPTAPCGQCYYCRRGDENLCDVVMNEYVLGAYAEFVKLPSRIVSLNLFPKPARLSFPEAALLEPLSCVVHGLSMVPLRPDAKVVIIGAGAIGLLHLLVLRAHGIEDVIVVGRGNKRVRKAREVGAHVVLEGGAEHALEPVLELTGGRGADIVIECTGQVEVWNVAPSLARRGGWVVLFGGCASGTVARFDTHRLHYDQVRLVSPFHFTPRAVRRAYDLLAGGTVVAHGLISGEFPLDALEQALICHYQGEGIKYAIIP